MGSVTFNAHTGTLAVSSQVAFHFLSNLNNLDKFMPEQVVNWNATADECSFDIKGMAHITLRVAERNPSQTVTIVSAEGTPIDFSLRFDLEPLNEKSSSCNITLDAKLSFMLQMMASGPLQNLVNIIAEKMTEHFQGQGPSE